MIELRPYQKEVYEKAINILSFRNVVYLALEMRTGKTLTSLSIANFFGGSILFVTKLKAIEGIMKDIEALGVNNVDVINYESLHKCKKEYDTVINDESSVMGAFPVPSLRTTQMKAIKRKRTILMSGTPHPESASQLYHQFWTTGSFWGQHGKFYSWAKDFVSIKKIKVAYNKEANDYSDANYEKVRLWTDPVTITLSQTEAGFVDNIEVIEHKLETPINIRQIIGVLKKDKIVNGSKGIILGDTPVKLMQKEHQITSGSCLLEDGTSILLSSYKADYIKANFKNAVVFYKYKAELELLEAANLEGCKLLQLQSGSMGLTLTEYDSIIYFNLDFSCVNWLQSIQRINYKGRDVNKVHVILSANGLDNKILKTLKMKEDFSIKIYKSF